MTLMEMLMAMGVTCVLMGAVLSLQLQGARTYSNVVASDWATFDGARGVAKLEKDIRECVQVAAGDRDWIQLLRPELATDPDSGAQVPVYPLSGGAEVRYYLSDLTGEWGVTGTCLWRETRSEGATAFVRELNPLGRHFVDFVLTYDGDATSPDGAVESVGVYVETEYTEQKATSVQTHSSVVNLRNARYVQEGS